QPDRELRVADLVKPRFVEPGIVARVDQRDVRAPIAHRLERALDVALSRGAPHDPLSDSRGERHHDLARVDLPACEAAPCLALEELSPVRVARERGPAADRVAEAPLKRRDVHEYELHDARIDLRRLVRGVRARAHADRGYPILPERIDRRANLRDGLRPIEDVLRLALGRRAVPEPAEIE